VRTPFSHKGRRGSVGVLMPETGDGTQGLPQKSTPVRTPFSHKGRRGSVGVLMPETIASYISVCDAMGEEGVWAS